MSIACQRPGCGGTIIDGVCEDCGRPPIGASLLGGNPLAGEGGATGVAGGGTTATLRAGPWSTTTGAAGSRTASATQSFATQGLGTIGTGATGTGRGSRRLSSRSSRGSSSRRQALGGGLVSLPPQPPQDPLALVMAVPEVPERKRRCPGCDAKVNRTKGFCPKCGREYNFEPSLVAGDLLAARFEVKGPIAFGGLGWIYLAYDQTLSRWVVLKGLLNAKDEAAANAALAERQFLAAVKHPKIVGIYDFITHGSEGFIVMEYVGGRTIKDIQKDSGVLPVEEAISYILGILPAFAYLHAHGFVYCDFKPDNFMLEDDDVKLIDMGGVRRIGDPSGDIYGTKGFMAPEAADDPVAVSDLYTIGRTLAVMILRFDHQTDYETSLPLPGDQALLAQYDALYRFLLRATHADGDERFQSADEMADQLYGVLREIVAIKSGPRPAESKVFGGDTLLDADDEAGAAAPLLRLLPDLKADIADPAVSDLLRLAGVTDPARRLTALQTLAVKYPKSAELRLRLAEAQVPADGLSILHALEQEDPFDWRIFWVRGKLLLALGRAAEARAAFDRVYFEMPGEIAPKLAIAFALETGHQIEPAARYYERVARLDPAYTSACFGLARCRILLGDWTGAAAAYALVPPQHSLFNVARIALARLLLAHDDRIDESILAQAEAAIAALAAQGGVSHQLAAKLLSAALMLIDDGKTRPDPTRLILGHPLEIVVLRRAAEAEYRAAGRYAGTAEEKRIWVDLANAVRPLTLI